VRYYVLQQHVQGLSDLPVRDWAQQIALASADLPQAFETVAVVPAAARDRRASKKRSRPADC